MVVAEGGKNPGAVDEAIHGQEFGWLLIYVLLLYQNTVKRGWVEHEELPRLWKFIVSDHDVKGAEPPSRRRARGL